METEIRHIKKILLVEDDPRDVELTLAALEEYNLANGLAHGSLERLTIDFANSPEYQETKRQGGQGAR